MRVSPILANIFPQRGTFKNNNQCDYYSCYRIPVTNDVFTPSFSGKNLIYVPIKTMRDFRLHAVKQQLPCMYCGRPMTYTNSTFELWKQQHLFSGPIERFVKVLKPYKKSLHDTEKAIFEFIEILSKKSPDAKLHSAIKILSLEANKALLKEQRPIFKELISTSTQLPVEYQYKLFELIQKSQFRMLKKPHIEEFSGKEFAYKMKNLSKTVPDEKFSQRIRQLSELLTIPSIKDDNTPLDKKVIKRVLTTVYSKTNKTNLNINADQYKTRQNLRHLIIQTLKKETEPLNRKDITAQCIDGEKRLQGLPVVCKFSNKAFLYDMDEILQGLNNKKLRAKLFEIANKLPTSDGSVNAFITKHDSSSSEKIAYDMLSPSVVTIEHMWPKFHNGPKDAIKNMAIACKRCNNSRQDKDMKMFLRLFNPKNQEHYWNRIMLDTKNGYFSAKDVEDMLEIFEQQSGRKIKFRHNN